MVAVRVLTGDLFASPAQTLVNAVNCVGVMGKGIALAFKRRYPAMYADYAQRCAAGSVRPGEPYLFAGPTLPWILNFPTKRHWRSPSRVEDIVAGLDYLERHYQAWEITSLATPALGCGLGQLAWREVGPMLYERLSRLDIPVELYAPMGHQKRSYHLETESKRPYYSVSEAAELVGVSEQVIENWISRNILRGYRQGDSVVIPRAELDGYRSLADAAKSLGPLPDVDEVIEAIRAGRRRFEWPRG